MISLVKHYKEKDRQQYGLQSEIAPKPIYALLIYSLTYTFPLPFIVAFDSADPDVAVSNGIPVVLQ